MLTQTRQVHLLLDGQCRKLVFGLDPACLVLLARERPGARLASCRGSSMYEQEPFHFGRQPRLRFPTLDCDTEGDVTEAPARLAVSPAPWGAVLGVPDGWVVA
jgi:hypothetical protein